MITFDVAWLAAMVLSAIFVPACFIAYVRGHHAGVKFTKTLYNIKDKP